MRAIVLVSGGMDSCVTAAMAAQETKDLWFLHVNYGQRTEGRELQAFRAMAEHFGVTSERRLICSIAYLTQIGGSSLTDREIPVSAADLSNPEIPTSYVPFRNAHFLSTAVSWAEVIGAERITIGAVYEDSSGYPDCRPAYYEAFNSLIAVGTAHGNIHIETPLINMSKSEIVRKGIELRAPLNLSWSCYQGEDFACGVCDSCALRLRGFAEAGVVDPISYRVRPDYSGLTARAQAGRNAGSTRSVSE